MAVQTPVLHSPSPLYHVGWDAGAKDLYSLVGAEARVLDSNCRISAAGKMAFLRVVADQYSSPTFDEVD